MVRCSIGPTQRTAPRPQPPTIMRPVSNPWKEERSGPVFSASVDSSVARANRVLREHRESAFPRTLVRRLSNRVAFRLSDGERRSGGVDLAQDVFALGFPHVAPGILIARRQESDDGIGQFSGRGKALFGNELGEVAKEALDQIHPG